MAKYQCLVCNATFDSPDGQTPVCPLCKSKNVKVIKK